MSEHIPADHGPEPVPADQGPELIFAEPGASWLWVLLGPIAATAMALVQRAAGVGFQPLVPLMFLVLVTGVLIVQVKAGRIHTSIELTRDALREGTETILISEIVTVLCDGSVLAQGTLDEVQADERVIEVYLGR